MMHFISSAVWIAVMFFVLKMITSAVNYFILAALKQKKDSETRQKQARGLIIKLLTPLAHLLKNKGRFQLFLEFFL